MALSISISISNTLTNALLQLNKQVCLAKRFGLRLMRNSCIEVFGYKIRRDFYMWALPLSALKTLFC